MKTRIILRGLFKIATFLPCLCLVSEGGYNVNAFGLLYTIGYIVCLLRFTDYAKPEKKAEDELRKISRK